MKGTHVFNNKIFSIELNKEKFQQGDLIKGQINEGFDGEFFVTLIYGDARKINFDDEKSFTIINELSLNDIDFSLNLSPNIQVSEKNNNLFLLFGPDKNFVNQGKLKILIEPLLKLEKIYQYFETMKRFKIKSIKNKKNALETCFTPPSGKEYSHIDLIKFLSNSNDEKINLKIEVKIKKLQFNGSIASTKSEVRKMTEEIELKKCFSFGDSPDPEYLNKFFSSFLDGLHSSKIFV